MGERRKENPFKEGLKIENFESQFDGQEVYNRRSRTIADNLVQGRRIGEATNYYSSLSTQEKMRIENERRKVGHREKREIRGARTGKAKEYKGSKSRMTKAIAMGAGIMLVLGLVGGLKGNDSYANANVNLQSENTLEEVVKNDDTLEMLGINRETAEEIQKLQAELSSEEIENLSDSDLLSLGERVESVQMDTIKEKLSKTLGVSEDEITVTPDYSWGSRTNKGYVTVTKDGEETVYNLGDFLDGNNNISQEISDSIINLGNTQTVNSKVKDGEFDRDGAIEQYRSGVDDASRIAIKEMTIDGNGNISLEEMDDLIQNNGRTQDDVEER